MSLAAFLVNGNHGETMTDTTEAELPFDKRPPARGTVRTYWALSGGFWKGGTARRAWLLTGLGAVLVVANIAVQYGINRWNRYFFNALDRHDSSTVFQAIGLFAALAFLAAALAVVLLLCRMRLQINWRQWLTQRLARRWLDEQRFYRLSISAPDLDAPEFRIAEDARIATEPVIDFGYGIGTAVLTAAVFFGVLWNAGGSATLLGITVPGFMVYAAIVYSIVVSGMMILFGYPLIGRIERRNAAEAQLRYEMGRVRENAESIAMIGGADDEMKGIGATVATVSRAWASVVSQQAKMTWLMGGNGVLAPVLPLLMGAPNYLNGTISLGQLMQAAAAFVQVQVALNWLVDNYARIAEWLASVGRVVGLWTALSDLDASVGESETDRITVEDSADEDLHLDGLSIAQHDGRVMIDEADTTIRRGEKVLLMGDSGTGKSTLIRAIAGLWPWGSGRVLLPAGSRIAFLPQHPYMPLGTLRSVLEYPMQDDAHDDATLTAALARCGLKRLARRLDDEERWDKQLSGGEQQRIAFARLLVQRPDIVVMDEATAALDTDSQDAMMDLFRDELADVTMISVGHRPELEEYHDRKLTLHRMAASVAMSSEEDDARRRRGLAGLLRRGLRPRPSPDPSAPVSLR